jgi:CRISPR-associated endonuclease/helicase Cas3
VQGLFEAYAKGRSQFQANRGSRPVESGAATPICCLWIDEFSQHHAPCADSSTFETEHQCFVTQRALALAQQAQEPRRRLALVALEGLSARRDEACVTMANAILQSVVSLHAQHHSMDPQTGDESIKQQIKSVCYQRSFVKLVPWRGLCRLSLEFSCNINM